MLKHGSVSLALESRRAHRTTRWPGG
ncbi:hypothetical protein FPZ52_11570 (plasmid) [Qingshengfaniella alkalisoli]|uniref:Uncharacterized protein n=1 Tax=Qingshengfaniella alkalisoli TaxID=2599296 RepID=A0A5B8IY79_9RHOB|nr:hypothetical protein FPZ52_11570 [Qingshengfaniella alkalisoli]